MKRNTFAGPYSFHSLTISFRSWGNRFSGRSHDAIKAMYLLPSYLEKLDDDSTVVESILTCYESDLPSSDNFKQELKLWRRFWSSREKDELPSTVSDTLNKISIEGAQLIYPNIMTILHKVLTFSATSASVERTNSALRFIKTSYRSTMCEERFNALILLFVHRDISLDYAKIIHLYFQRHPRRMLFINPLMETESD